MKRIAYLRVSTAEQRPDRQIVGLQNICDELHIEKSSAKSLHRPIYEVVLRRLRPGDVLVVWALDRAYRNTKDALNEIDRLTARGIGLHIASMNIDTTTPIGKLLYTFTSALAEFERDLLSQRTKEGLEAAKRRGQRLGRPPKMTKRQLCNAARKLRNESCCVREIAASYGVDPWTLRRALKREELISDLGHDP